VSWPSSEAPREACDRRVASGSLAPPVSGSAGPCWEGSPRVAEPDRARPRTGSKLFTAIVPLSILLSGLLSSPDVVANRRIDGFGLTESGAQAVRDLFHGPSGQADVTISVIGVSALSFAGALQRVRDASPRHRFRGLVWVRSGSSPLPSTSP
jgi:hypothetical protein